MSNSAASNVSAPVDGINWLLRKAGLPVSEAPVMGSDWLAQRGYTRPVQQNAASLAGDAAGMIGPMLAVAKAPQFAKGLLSLDDKAMDMGRVAIENHMVKNGMIQNILPPQRYIGRPLDGLPEMVHIGNGRMEAFGTDQRIVDIAGQYMADKGMKYTPQTTYAALDPVLAKRLADDFAAMKNNPRDPRVRGSYEALAKETQDQYEALLKSGYKFDFIKGVNPYGNPRNAINDLVANKRMSVYPTERGFGGPSAAALDVSNNPLLARSELRIGNDPSTTYNDLFRAVHDTYGHAKHGVGFRARGEENAFQSHSRMYSPQALPAATSETRGQNSWVNFGPFAKTNVKASSDKTEYAPQKTGLLDPYAWLDGLVK